MLDHIILCEAFVQKSSSLPFLYHSKKGPKSGIHKTPQAYPNEAAHKIIVQIVAYRSGHFVLCDQIGSIRKIYRY